MSFELMMNVCGLPRRLERRQRQMQEQCNVMTLFTSRSNQCSHGSVQKGHVLQQVVFSRLVIVLYGLVYSFICIL